MVLTSKLKQDIIDLLDHLRRLQAAKGDESWADSKASKACFGHGEFMMNLRKWDGGKGSPTMEKVMEFEQFLRAQMKEKEYERFLKTRTRPTTNQSEPDDIGFGD